MIFYIFTMLISGYKDLHNECIGKGLKGQIKRKCMKIEYGKNIFGTFCFWQYFFKSVQSNIFSY